MANPRKEVVAWDSFYHASSGTFCIDCIDGFHLHGGICEENRCGCSHGAGATGKGSLGVRRLFFDFLVGHAACLSKNCSRLSSSWRLSLRNLQQGILAGAR